MLIKRLAGTFAAAAVALGIGACGGGSPQPAGLKAVPQCNPKPPAQLGACINKSKAVKLQPKGPKAGGLHGVFPDVSSYQGSPNWNTVKAAGVAGAVVKAGEGGYGQDHSFSYNWRALRGVKLWHSAYWFGRPGNCTGQADQFVSIVKANGGFDSGPPVVDSEVPGVDTGCIVARIEADLHSNAVEVYTAPGTWPGGSHGNAGLWVATYGSHPSFSNLWTTKPVAWQFTDGVYGSPVYIPGIGRGDASYDYGLTKITSAPPPDPYAIYDKTRRTIKGSDHASEYNTVKAYDAAKCKPPTKGSGRRTVCRTSEAHLVWLEGRLWSVTHQHGKATWGLYHRGARFQGMWHRK